MKAVETKRLTILNEQYAGYNNPTTRGYAYYIRNVFSPIPQGTQSWAMTGSEIQDALLRIKIRAELSMVNARTFTTQFPGVVSYVFHVWVVASAYPLDLDVPVLLDTSGGSADLGFYYQRDPWTPTFNGHNVKVLKHWTRSFNPKVVELPSTSAVSGHNMMVGRLSCRFKGRKRFQDSGVNPPSSGGIAPTGLLKGWNYYIIGGWGTIGDVSATLTPPWSLKLDSYLYYKDP